MTVWNVIMTDIVGGGLSRTEELVVQSARAIHDRAVVLQSSAYIVMTYDPARAALLQRYALEQYRVSAQWIPLIACAHESLFFSSLRLLALQALLDACLHLEDQAWITRSGVFVCQQHEKGLITKGQLCSLFFNALVPYYHKQLKSDYLSMLRISLREYNQDYSDLVYSYLQANLYSYTSDMAQQLIGQHDVLARS